jgi:hypothetical protein
MEQKGLLFSFFTCKSKDKPMYLVGTVIMFSVVVSLDGMMIHDASLGL